MADPVVPTDTMTLRTVPRAKPAGEVVNQTVSGHQPNAGSTIALASGRVANPAYSQADLNRIGSNFSRVGTALAAPFRMAGQAVDAVRGRVQQGNAMIEENLAAGRGEAAPVGNYPRSAAGKRTAAAASASPEVAASVPLAAGEAAPVGNYPHSKAGKLAAAGLPAAVEPAVKPTPAATVPAPTVAPAAPEVLPPEKAPTPETSSLIPRAVGKSFGDVGTGAEGEAARGAREAARVASEAAKTLATTRAAGRIDPATGKADAGRHTDEAMAEFRALSAAPGSEVSLQQLQYLKGVDPAAYKNPDGTVNVKAMNEDVLRKEVAELTNTSDPTYLAQAYKDFIEQPAMKQIMREGNINVPVNKSRYGGYQPGALEKAAELKAQAASAAEAKVQGAFAKMIEDKKKRVADLDVSKEKGLDREAELAKAKLAPEASLGVAGIHAKTATEKVGAEKEMQVAELANKLAVSENAARAHVEAAEKAANAHVAAARESAKTKGDTPEEKALKREKFIADQMKPNIEGIPDKPEVSAAKRKLAVESLGRAVAAGTFRPGWTVGYLNGKKIIAGYNKDTGELSHIPYGEE